MFPDFPAADRRHHQAGIARAFARVLESGRFILGDEVAAFEAEYAAHLGSGHVVGLASGTDAVEMMLRGLGIGRGARVALPSLAPSAVAAAVRRAGAEIVLVDVEDETLTLCPHALAEALESPQGREVKAALAVHLHGHVVAWEALGKVCEAHGVVLLEDASQAHDARWNGKPAGTLGIACAWSFYPTKSLGALGDAGAVSTRDGDLAARLKQMRQYGWRERHISEIEGINSRLDELQAAVLREKLSALQAQTIHRRELARHYMERLRGVRLPVVREGCEHAFHQFVVRSTRREALGHHLLQHAVPVAVHYSVALHQQPAFACPGSFPVADKAVTEVLSLPMHPYLTAEAVEAVCAIVEAHSA